MKRYLIQFVILNSKQEIERTFDSYRWAAMFAKQMPRTYFIGEDIQINEPTFFGNGYFQTVTKNNTPAAKIFLKQISI